MIDKQKQKLNMKVQWTKFAIVLVLYLAFLLWVHKLDAPSGTAITLAEEIIDNLDRKKDWKRGVTYWSNDGHQDEGDQNITSDDLVINCVRDGEVPGIHAVMYDSEADMITIEHSAHSRKGFALGAVLAAEFTATHSGLLTTSDLFKF